MSRIFVFAVLVTSLCATSAADIVIDGYTDETNDRFTNSPSFIGNNFDGLGNNLDFSGVGQNAGRRWATLVSRNVIITAEHFNPRNSVVHFYEGNDPTGSSVSRTVLRGERIGSTDIWLGVLNSNVPDSISAYEVASQFLSGTPNPLADAPFDDAGDYQDLSAYVFGRSPFNTGSDATRESYNDQAVGRNRITGYAENVAFDGQSDNGNPSNAQIACPAKGMAKSS